MTGVAPPTMPRPPSGSPTSDELNVESLEALFPGWHCWRAQFGGVPSSWMATRRPVLTAFEHLDRRHNTLMAPTAGELRDLLVEQARIDHEEG